MIHISKLDMDKSENREREKEKERKRQYTVHTGEGRKRTLEPTPPQWEFVFFVLLK